MKWQVNLFIIVWGKEDQNTISAGQNGIPVFVMEMLVFEQCADGIIVIITKGLEIYLLVYIYISSAFG